MGEQQVLRTRLKLSSLLQVCQDISGVLDLEELLNQILDRAILVIGAERGYLLLYENGELEVKVARGLEKEELGTKPFEFSRSLIMQVEKEGRPIVTIDAQADPRFKMHESVILYGLRSILCVPLKRKERLLGILYMDNRLVSRLFTEEEMELMMAFGAQAAIAIDNASAYFQIAELNENLETKVQERTGELAGVNRQLEESNKKLKEFDRLKTMFLSLVSHELRTPLTSIKGFVENMLDGFTGGLNNKQKDYLKRIKSNTDRLTRMINDLLDLSAIESGRIRLSPVELSPSEVAKEVVEQLKPLAAEKNLFIEIIAPDQAPKIWADQDKLNQIMINLLNNAIKFTPAGGRIRIETGFNDKDSFVCVHDNGVGISPEDLPKIFDPFFQVSRQAEEKVQGSGLGLTITKSLVELHWGKIWVKSEIGCGSEFAFTLPMKNQGVSN
ncbi:MAG: GAF domain-containing sensor histidine kinase [Nitrospirae bacterium]|nr:GAF domain-containing sensor histidine kinase [Nitrospirota bacterium]